MLLRGGGSGLLFDGLVTCLLDNCISNCTWYNRFPPKLSITLFLFFYVGYTVNLDIEPQRAWPLLCQSQRWRRSFSATGHRQIERPYLLCPGLSTFEHPYSVEPGLQSGWNAINIGSSLHLPLWSSVWGSFEATWHSPCCILFHKGFHSPVQCCWWFPAFRGVQTFPAMYKYCPFSLEKN